MPIPRFSDPGVFADPPHGVRPDLQRRPPWRWARRPRGEKHIPHPTHRIPGGLGIGTDADSTHRTEHEAHLATAFVVLLALWALERIFAMTFILNFGPDGPGLSILILLLSATGFLYLTPLARTWPHGRRVLDASLAILVLATIGAHLLTPLPNLIFAVVALGAATPLLATVAARQGRNVVFGLALGMLVHVAARAWNGTLPLPANPAGRILGTIILAAGTVLWITHERHRFARSPDEDARPRLALIMTLLIFEAAFLLHPAAIAGWAGTSVWTLTVATAGGLAVGAGLNFTRSLPPWLRWKPVLLLAGGTIWITYGAGQAGIATVLVQIGAIRLAARATGTPPDTTMPYNGMLTGLAQLTATLILFLHIAGPRWAQLPEPLATVTRDFDAFWLLALAGFTALLATPGIVAYDQEAPL